MIILCMKTQFFSLFLATMTDDLSVYPIGSNERFSITCRGTVSAENVNDTTHVEPNTKNIFSITFINIYCECIN